MTTNITVVTKTPEPVWVRLVRAGLVAAVVYGLYVFLRDRLIFEPAIVVGLSALAFWGQTWGRGLPMRLPDRFQEPAAVLRRGIGESAWQWVNATSRVWTILQALAFGLVAAFAQWVTVSLLSLIMDAEKASFIGTTLAVAACSFGLGLLIRKMAVHFGLRPWLDEFKESLKRSAGIDLFGSIGPTGSLAVGSLFRALAVQLMKMAALASSAWFFEGWGAIIFIGAALLFFIVLPDQVKGFVGRLKSDENKNKEAGDV